MRLSFRIVPFRLVQLREQLGFEVSAENFDLRDLRVIGLDRQLHDGTRKKIDLNVDIVVIPICVGARGVVATLHKPESLGEFLV